MPRCREGVQRVAQRDGLKVTPVGADEIVNSRSHPAAYAKLGRRMASMNPSEFPNMQKLWNGNRQEGVVKCDFFGWDFINASTFYVSSRSCR